MTEEGQFPETGIPAMDDPTMVEAFKSAANMLIIAVRAILCSNPRRGRGHVDVSSVDCALASQVLEEEVKKLDKDREETKESLKERAEIARTLATDCLHELRPEEFPPELWVHVFDTEKPSVKARFAVFDEVPEKKAKAIHEVMNISISEESESRKAELPIFRAMLLANLDRFMHPRDNDIPKMKDVQFDIELLEGEETPSVAKYQHFDVWETRFLHLQIKQMMLEGRVERSTSPWNARLQLVPYTARIRAFIEEHGAKCVDALMDDKYADTTVALIYPLPNIQNLFDKCAGSKRYTMGDIPSAFFSVATGEKSRMYLAYTTPDGHFQNMVMAQGAKNAAVKWAATIAEKFEPMTSAGKKHIAADAVSRLLRVDEEQYVYTEDELREDFGPLTPGEIEKLQEQFQQDAQLIVDIVNQRREEEKIKREEMDLQMYADAEELESGYLPSYEGEPRVQELDEFTMKQLSDNVRQMQRDERAKYDIARLLEAVENRELQVKGFVKRYKRGLVEDFKVTRADVEVQKLDQDSDVESWVDVKSVNYSPMEDDDYEDCCADIEAEDAKRIYGEYNQTDHIDFAKHNILGTTLRLRTDSFTRGGKRDDACIQADIERAWAKSSANKGHKEPKWALGHNGYLMNEHDAVALFDESDSDSESESEDEKTAVSEYIGQMRKMDKKASSRRRLESCKVKELSLVEQLKAGIKPKEVFTKKRLPEYPTFSLRQALLDTRINLRMRMEIKDELNKRADQKKFTPIPSMRTEELLRRITVYYDKLESRPFREMERQKSLSEYAKLTEEEAETRAAQWILEQSKVEELLEETSIRIIDVLESAEAKHQLEASRINERRAEINKRNERYTAMKLKRIKEKEAELKRETKALRVDKDLVIDEKLIDAEEQLEQECEFLNSRMFKHPDTDDIYQVFDVFKSEEPVKKGQEAKILAQCIRYRREQLGIIVPEDILVMEVWGRDGVAELVSQYELAMQNHADIPIPRTNQEWLEAQMEDAYCRTFIDKIGDQLEVVVPLDGKLAGNSERYMYREKDGDKPGLLMRKIVRERKIGRQSLNVSIKQEVLQIVVPKSLIDKIMWIMHDQLGHPGRNRTTETTKMRYYWPGMNVDIQNVCKDCHYCNKRKANNIVAKDMQSVQMEYVDKFTTMWGAPLKLITDRGTEFHNLVARQLAELWGVKKISTTARNPRADGQAENAMRTIKDMLQAFINDNQTDWDEKLAVVAQAYNSTINDAVGMTPYFLVFVTKQKEAQSWCWQYAAEKCSTNADKGARVPMERLEFVPFKVGDFFYNRVIAKRSIRDKSLKERLKLSSKFQYRYVGPYMITEIISPVVYKSIVHNKEKVVHALNIKPMVRSRRLKGRVTTVEDKNKEGRDAENEEEEK
eukprot:gene21823-27892_t